MLITAVGMSILRHILNRTCPTRWRRVLGDHR